mmetsp:Transcript_85352/g.149227  ORF Transcript_85352/g.149227 Transcript_85352/m.149227 type:complete len:574 (-) Transcript_85352:807-2528(-)
MADLSNVKLGRIYSIAQDFSFVVRAKPLDDGADCEVLQSIWLWDGLRQSWKEVTLDSAPLEGDAVVPSRVRIFDENTGTLIDTQQDSCYMQIQLGRLPPQYSFAFATVQLSAPGRTFQDFRPLAVRMVETQTHLQSAEWDLSSSRGSAFVLAKAVRKGPRWTMNVLGDPLEPVLECDQDSIAHELTKYIGFPDSTWSEDVTERRTRLKQHLASHGNNALHPPLADEDAAAAAKQPNPIQMDALEVLSSLVASHRVQVEAGSPTRPSVSALSRRSLSSWRSPTPSSRSPTPIADLNSTWTSMRTPSSQVNPASGCLSETVPSTIVLYSRSRPTSRLQSSQRHRQRQSQASQRAVAALPDAASSDSEEDPPMDRGTLADELERLRRAKAHRDTVLDGVSQQVFTRLAAQREHHNKRLEEEYRSYYAQNQDAPKYQQMGTKQKSVQISIDFHNKVRLEASERQQEWQEEQKRALLATRPWLAAAPEAPGPDTIEIAATAKPKAYRTVRLDTTADTLQRHTKRVIDHRLPEYAFHHAEPFMVPMFGARKEMPMGGQFLGHKKLRRHPNMKQSLYKVG